LDVADRHPFTQEGDAQCGSVPEPSGDRAALREFNCFGLKVGDVDQAAFNYRASAYRSAVKRYAAGSRHWPVMSYKAQDISVRTHEDSVECVAQLRGATRDRVEDRLNISRRARDDRQDLRSNGLLLARLGQLLLQLLDHAAKVWISRHCRPFRRHGNVHSS
jgi:hypothetical protein